MERVLFQVTVYMYFNTLRNKTVLKMACCRTKSQMAQKTHAKITKAN